MSHASLSASSQQALQDLGTQAPVPEWVGLLRSKVESLRFGVVQLVVHDGRITQIDRTEKTRIETALEA